MTPQVLPYHHGDLRTALIDAGLEVARTGGVAAVRVREVTRVAGVSPNSVYRHFDDHGALVNAVAWAAQLILADSIQSHLPTPGSVEHAMMGGIENLAAVGRGYIRWAIAEPGWYELALYTFDDDAGPAGVTVDKRVPPAFKLLLGALDQMVEEGSLDASDREGAEWPCWSAVHGFADIATRGPLRALDTATLHVLGDDVVDRVIAGLRRS